jgi:hypothetical protein
LLRFEARIFLFTLAPVDFSFAENLFCLFSAWRIGLVYDQAAQWWPSLFCKFFL